MEGEIHGILLNIIIIVAIIIIIIIIILIKESRHLEPEREWTCSLSVQRLQESVTLLFSF